MSKLSPFDEMSAGAMAEELIAGQEKKGRILKTLVDEFAIAEAQARRIVSAAEERLYKGLEADTKKRFNRVEAMQYDLYARCIRSEKFSAAARVLGNIQKLYHLDQPHNVIHPRTPEADEFEQYSAAELNYFAEHGCFPETDTTTRTNATPEPSDPLDELQ